MAKPPSQDPRRIAQAHERAGRLAEAGKAWQAAVRAAPRDPAARLGLARFANRHGGDPAAALPHVKALEQLAPRHPATHQEAAETYCRLERYGAARAHAATARKLAPNSADVLYVAATVENRAGRPDRAAPLIDAALARRPDHLPSHLLRASILVALGDMAAAQDLCRTLFQRSPNTPDIARIYHRTGKMTSDDPIIAHLRDVIRPALPDGARTLRAQAETILGKVASDEGRHTDAFDHFAKAKRIDPAPYDLPAYRAHVDALISGIRRPAYLGRTGHDSAAPVLIVGMPRSGSTLLEQILSGHPQIAGAGESPALRNIAYDLRLPLHDGPAMARAVTALTDAEARQLGQAYLDGLDITGAPARIIDKRLHNFELLGLFARLFPRGRILHSRRDPLDTCVSIHMQSFRKSHAYSWDLDDLGRYYLEYRRLMAHWTRELPVPILDVVYEDTVADLEATARRVIDFLGLDWDPACLAFQDTDNASRTLSQWQVRQPLYTTSMKRWQRYGDRIDPLLRQLAPLYPGGDPAGA